jgi:hypothetical protein
MVALPMIQQAEQGLASRVANAATAFFAPTDGGSSGQNVPSQAASAPANSAQPQSASTLSTSVTNALLQLQDSSSSSQVQGHHHHHGAGKYKAASDTLGQTSSISSNGSASGASSPVAAVTA